MFLYKLYKVLDKDIDIEIWVWGSASHYYTDRDDGVIFKGRLTDSYESEVVAEVMEESVSDITVNDQGILSVGVLVGFGVH